MQTALAFGEQQLDVACGTAGQRGQVIAALKNAQQPALGVSLCELERGARHPIESVIGDRHGGEGVVPAGVVSNEA